MDSDRLLAIGRAYLSTTGTRRQVLGLAARLATGGLLGSGLTSCSNYRDYSNGPVNDGNGEGAVLSGYAARVVVTPEPPGSTPANPDQPTSAPLEVYPFSDPIQSYLEIAADVTEFESQENGAIRHFQRAYGGGMIHFSVIDLSNPRIHFDVATPDMARPATIGTSASFVDQGGNPIQVAPMPPNALVDNYQQIHPDRRVAVAITGDFGYGSPEGTTVRYPHDIAKVNFGRSALCKLENGEAIIENIGDHNVNQCIAAIGGGPKSRRQQDGNILFNPDSEDFTQIGERKSRMNRRSNTTFASILRTPENTYLITSVGIGLTGYDHLLGLPPFNESMMLDDASQTYYETRARDANNIDTNNTQPVINDPITSALVVFVQS